MRKTLLFIFNLLFVASGIFARDEVGNLIGKDNKMTVDILGSAVDSSLFIEFKDQETYTFCSPFGGYLWSTAKYKTEGSKIILSVLTEENPFSNETLNALFSSSNENKYIEFDYDSEVCTFYKKGAYRHNNIVLVRSDAEQTPQGTVCYLDDIKVIKKSGYLIPTENLRVRKKPSLQAETGSIDYSYEIYSRRNDKYIGTERYDDTHVVTVDYSNRDSSVLLAGMVKAYDAVTAESQTIDGITAPWYRICFVDGEEGWPRYYWIFGGYIKEIKDTKNKEYEKLFVTSAVQKGYLRKE